MATQSTTTPKSKTSTKTQAKRTKTNTKRAANSAGRTAQAAAPEKGQVQRVFESVLDVPVGVVVGFGDRVTEIVDPFTDRGSAEKQLKTYRTQLRRSVKRAERRGATSRRKTTTRAKRTRTRLERQAKRVEKEARKRRHTVSTRAERVQSDVGRLLDEQSARAQDIVEQIGEQLPALR